ncbi:MAG: ABC transporter ATP-binding protein [Microvirga sp.]|nr:ABC transporter ATP-binding protein [Microvirga sp.]
MTAADANPVLSLRDVGLVHIGDRGATPILEGVSFTLYAGETVGIVGESGSGKTMTALAIMGLLPKSIHLHEGEILFRDIDAENGGVVNLATADRKRVRAIRGDRIAMIFQDPMTSLNPLMRVGRQIAEAVEAHRRTARASLRELVLGLLRKVRIPAPERRIDDYPHQFSGGMRQRIMLSMGIANAPALLIADEPTTALDVTVQAQVLGLVRELTDGGGTTTMLITHNLGIVAQLCSRVIVMYLGRVIEEGPVETLFASPRHPYTHMLLRATPRLDAPTHEPLANIPGAPPQIAHAPPGCKFADRCPRRLPVCDTEPALEAIGPLSRVRCWAPMETPTDAAHGSAPHA